MPKLEYRGRASEYRITRSDRKTLGIYVHPDLRVEARAPLHAEEDKIHARMLKRRRWIFRQIELFEQFYPQVHNLRYVSGASHKYLGRQYRLLVRDAGESAEETVKMQAGKLLVWTRNRDEDHVQALVQSWYSIRAAAYLSKRFDHLFEELQARLPLAREQVELVIKPLPKSWGRCRGRRITLNRELIHAPRLALDYVIIHELAHLIHPYHNRVFYHFLDRVLPDWRKRKEVLEGVYG